MISSKVVVDHERLKEVEDLLDNYDQTAETGTSYRQHLDRKSWSDPFIKVFLKNCPVPKHQVKVLDELGLVLSL